MDRPDRDALRGGPENHINQYLIILDCFKQAHKIPQE